jgi:hypothetical protein
MWSVSIGRAVGTAHERLGLPCQDDAMSRVSKGGASLVLAVADGAGSGRFTDHASAVAVRSASFLLKRALDGGSAMAPDVVRDVVHETRRDVAHVRGLYESAGFTVTAHDFGCTLILIAVDDDTLVMGQVGDGAAVSLSGGRLRSLSPGPTAEYVNVTTFLTSETAPDEMFVKAESAAELQALAIMTDGVQHLGIRYPANEPFPGLFEPVFEYARANGDLEETERGEALTALLESQQVNEETDDDKTLVVAVRCPVGVGPSTHACATDVADACDRCRAALVLDVPYCRNCGGVNRRWSHFQKGYAHVLHRWNA